MDGYPPFGHQQHHQTDGYTGTDKAQEEAQEEDATATHSAGPSTPHFAAAPYNQHDIRRKVNRRATDMKKGAEQQLLQQQGWDDFLPEPSQPTDRTIDRSVCFVLTTSFTGQ